jgi:Cd2+/Zn2+-exporting ATPase
MGADAASWMYRALVLLVVACPCALVISTPVSFVAALAAAARHGVLVKGGIHFERLARARVVAFDKTGTLTHGRLDVTDVLPCAELDRDELLRYAASAEARSEHVIARAIVAGAHRMGLQVPEPEAFLSMPGLGVEATVSGRRVLVGNERLLASKQVPVLDEALMGALRADGRTVVLVAVDGLAAGFIGVADRERDVAAQAVALVRRQGVERTVMLTGDHEVSARATAEALGLDEYRAGLLPEEKHAAVQTLQRTFGSVLMVGDGVNDAPALAAADVGIAMASGGTDAALEAADVALVSDDLLKLPYAIRLARATVRTIRTNVAISLVMKAAFVVMAATGAATLWMAVLADTGASVLVVANALRLIRTK